MSFRVLLDGMIDYLGEATDPDQEKHYKYLLNNSLQMISEDEPWDFLKRRGVVKLLGPVNTGTFDVTAGSTRVDANTVTLSYDMVGGEIDFTVTDDGTRYEVVAYDALNSQLVLNIPFQGATAVGVAFSLTKLLYVLPHDVGHYHVGKMQEQRRVVTGHGDETSDYTDPYGDSRGVPSGIAMKGHTDAALYNTGTVTIVHEAAAVLGIGTVFDAEFVGRSFRVAGDMRMYKILSVTDDLNMTLAEVYRSEQDDNDDVTALRFEIEPKGSAEVSFEFGLPDQDMIHNFVYTAIQDWLVSDDEYPAFPARMYQTIHAHIKWQLMEEEDEPVEVVQNAEKRYNTYKKRHLTRHRTINPQYQMPSRVKRGRHFRRFGADASGVDGAGGIIWGIGG